MRFLSLVVLISFFCPSLLAQEILKKGDSVCFVEVYTDSNKVHDVAEAYREGNFLRYNKNGVSFDTAKKRIIVKIDTDRFFWLEDPDYVYEKLNWKSGKYELYQGRPGKIIRPFIKDKKIYYNITNLDKRYSNEIEGDNVQYSLIKNDTSYLRPFELYPMVGGYDFFSIYKSDTVLSVNGQQVTCYRFYCKSYVANSAGCFSEFDVLVDKKSLLPIMETEYVSYDKTAEGFGEIKCVIYTFSVARDPLKSNKY